MNDNIIEIIRMIINRPKMFFEKKSINNLFRFLDGYYFYKNSQKIRNKIDDYFWNNFLEYLFVKFDIIDKSTTVEDIIKNRTNNDEESFELFATLFNDFCNKNTENIIFISTSDYT